ncbi:hypothetical protein LJ739_02470 [Aestuariibacter halophilus]|uniref:Lipopolysaccharide heptosyltransferase family protein n=1 Tax=Fluctibacter halophilus TaxID=226011 RepID=A0ABS8G7A1_9ALTE|nr:hypothetical protein [Aestuariibacter halophilus]MCC2615106.1 hypothetical protein [Aestuariibacter halophilus]
MSTANHPSKILVIRMLEVGDVCSIAVPAIRHFKQRFPNAEIDCLTYGEGQSIIELAEPDVRCHTLEQGQWPDNILQAMECFLGLAETIVAQKYDLIVNLDTAFMPCFLARFLKDAGEPVQGNFMNQSVQALIDGFQSQQLDPAYVAQYEQYMDSTWFAMSRWHQSWWLGEPDVEQGYPEYYLRRCCEMIDIDMDMHIDVAPDPTLSAQHKLQKVVAVAVPEQLGAKPNVQRLLSALKEAGVHGWQITPQTGVRQILSGLAASDLLVALPGAEQWYATATGCPSLILVGDMDPRILMPDYATEQHAPMPDEATLVENVLAIVRGEVHE